MKLSKMLSRFVTCVLLVAMLLSMVACGQNSSNNSSGQANSTGNNTSDADEIVIGYIDALTGEAAVWGLVGKYTLEMLIEETNENGGIMGKQVVLKTYDNRGDPVETTNAARKAIQSDHVLAFLGPATSSNAIALAEVCDEYHVPFISNCASNYGVTQKEDGTVRPYAFRTCPSDPQQGDIIASYAYDELGIERVAIIYEISSDYSMGVMTNFTESFTAKGGEIVISEAFKTGDNDFRAQLTKIKSTGGFDALFVPCTYKEIALITTQARALGLDQQFLGGETWTNSDLFTLADESVQGAYFTNTVDLNDPILDDFKEDYFNFCGEDAVEVGSNTFLMADAYAILCDAIERAGVLDSEKIRDEIEATDDLQCLTTKISFDPETHNPYREVIIYTIEGTDYVKVGKYAFKAE